MGRLKGIIAEDRQLIVQSVVREVAIMSGGVVSGEGGTTAGLQTKAGGYILTRGGLRILAK